ncbi:hypothetical protein ACF06O_30610 [Streptomyces albidoflavus]
METPELQPDVPEIIQAEAEPLTTVPVRVSEVQAPVRVQVLPRKAAATATKAVAEAPVRILRADHRRARALLVGSTDFLVAFSEASCQAESSMALWPAGIPLELTATTEVWAMAPGGASLSVVTERWAEGE